MPDPRADRAVLVLPSMDSVVVVKDLVSTTGRTLDMYRHPNLENQALPAVVFVPGDAPEEIIADAKQGGQYVSWGQLLALSGLFPVTPNPRSTSSSTHLRPAAHHLHAALSS